MVFLEKSKCNYIDTQGPEFVHYPLATTQCSMYLICSYCVELRRNMLAYGKASLSKQFQYHYMV